MTSERFPLLSRRSVVRFHVGAQRFPIVVRGSVRGSRATHRPRTVTLCASPMIFRIAFIRARSHALLMTNTDRRYLAANIADLRAQIATETNHAARRCLEGTLAEMQRRLAR